MKRREFERTTPPKQWGYAAKILNGCWTSWKAALLRCTA